MHPSFRHYMEVMVTFTVSVLARRVVAKYIIFTERMFLMNAHVFAIVVFTEARSEEQV